MRHKAHDEVFKKLMTDHKYRLAFLESYLPQSIKDMVDLRTAEIYNGHTEYINSLNKIKHNTSFADVVLLLKSPTQDILVMIHIEHQSSPDMLVPLRTAHYHLSWTLDYAISAKKTSNLPLVYSIIYYHGLTSPYPYSVDIFDLFADKELAREMLFKSHLVDLTVMSEEEIAKHKEFAMSDLVFKYIFNKKSLLKLLMTKIDELGEHEYLVDYIGKASNIEPKDLEQVAQNYSDNYLETKESVMNVFQQWRQEARAQGKLEGMLEGELKGKLEGERQGELKGKLEGKKNGIATCMLAIELLTQGHELKDVAKQTGITLAEVKRIEAKINKKSKNQ